MLYIVTTRSLHGVVSDYTHMKMTVIKKTYLIYYKINKKRFVPISLTTDVLKATVKMYKSEMSQVEQTSFYNIHFQLLKLSLPSYQ